MALKSDPEMGINSWLADELHLEYLHDHSAVDESWKRVFEQPRAPQESGEQLQPLRGAAGRIAENMAPASPSRWLLRSAPSRSR
jgi:2-oxoglutarate dehydrogenase complex dehydrogenase (E1) component-like enzyme